MVISLYLMLIHHCRSGPVWNSTLNQVTVWPSFRLRIVNEGTLTKIPLNELLTLLAEVVELNSLSRQDCSLRAEISWMQDFSFSRRLLIKTLLSLLSCYCRAILVSMQTFYFDQPLPFPGDLKDFTLNPLGVSQRFMIADLLAINPGDFPAMHIILSSQILLISSISLFSFQLLVLYSSNSDLRLLISQISSTLRGLPFISLMILSSFRMLDSFSLALVSACLRISSILSSSLSTCSTILYSVVRISASLLSASFLSFATVSCNWVFSFSTEQLRLLSLICSDDSLLYSVSRALRVLSTSSRRCSVFTYSWEFAMR